jgi:hypothetical protein
MVLGYLESLQFDLFLTTKEAFAQILGRIFALSDKV